MASDHSANLRKAYHILMTSSQRLSYMAGLAGVRTVKMTVVLFYITYWGCIVREALYLPAWADSSSPAIVAADIAFCAAQDKTDTSTIRYNC